jgi:pectinesterase inhibitor-like protein
MNIMSRLITAETKNSIPAAGRMAPYHLPHLLLLLLLRLVLLFSLLLHAPSSVQADSMQHTRRNLKQVANPAPGTNNNIVTQACGATNFPAACLSSLNADPRASSAATARDLVSIAIGIAHTHAATAVSDGQSLATQATTANNANLTSISNMCSEELDLASFHTLNSQTAMTGSQLSDVQAWLSGSLTFVTDCNAGLTQVAGALVLIPQMKARLDTTQMMISNALAMTDALVNYGPNTALWKPPAAKTTEQKLRAEAVTASMKILPDWISGSDRKFLEGDLFVGAPSVVVDHKAVGAFSIQHAVDLAPTWSSQR